jgi:prepilin peptidase CpaA
MSIITLVMTFMTLTVTVLSCISDVRSLRIPNWHALAIIGCFIPAWLATPQAFGVLWQQIATMIIIFGVTYLMFCKGIMGGGDSKLGTALGLWIGLQGLLPFLIYMGIMGGVIGILSLLMRNRKFFKNPLPGSWIEQLQNGRNAVPYGVAISFGAWAAFFHTGFVHNQLNEVFKIIH